MSTTSTFSQTIELQKLIIFAFIFLLSGCAHNFTLTHFESGTRLLGTYNELDRSVTVTMPNGETLKGFYSAVSSNQIRLANGQVYSGSQSASINQTTILTGGESKAYALLTSQQSSLMMEIIVSYSEWNGHGFGEAITNDGRTFKVQF